MTAPFLAGQTLAAGRLEIMRRPPAALAFNSSTQSVPTGIFSPVVLDAPEQDFDTDDMHDTVVNNSRITARTPGLFLVAARTVWPGGSSFATAMLLRPNGDNEFSIHRGGVNAISGLVANGQAVLSLAESDFVEVMVSHNASGSADVRLAEFLVVRIGAS